MDYNTTGPLSVSGLAEDDQQALAELWQTWSSKLPRNLLREKYYNGKNRLKDLGISIPPPLKNVETVVGWPAKAVDALSARSRFDGFTFESGTHFELDRILKGNGFKKTYRQATISELKGSCAFLTVSKGDSTKGEPGVLISAYSSLTSAACWDGRKKRIKYGMTIVDVNKNSNPSAINLYTDTHVIEIRQLGNGRWKADYKSHEQGRPLMEPLTYRSSIDRPFGKSRISREVMSITDSAVRTALRSEISSEFFTSPQRWALGIGEELFTDKDGNEKPKWEAYIGNFLAMGLNEEGDMPSVGQFPQMSMQPHTEYMRSLALRFASATSIPVSSLGIVQDNPSSAEAMVFATEDLVIEATDLNDDNRASLETIGKLVLAISQNKSIKDLTDDELTIMANFKNPSKPSLVSQADAMSKILSSMPEYAYSDVVLQELGFSQDQIMKLQSDRKKNQARMSVAAALVSEPEREGAKRPDEGSSEGASQGAEVSGKQLSGAQTQSLIAIMAQFTGGSITEGQAVNLIATAIGVSKQDAQDILNGKLD